jgi:NhaP-type Na+/H+ or K+/H+ antiporter
MLWSAGLRGAIAFGLVLQLRRPPGPGQPPQEGLPAIEAATLVIVVVSTLVFGTATGPLLRRLNLQARARRARPARVSPRVRAEAQARALGVVGPSTDRCTSALWART